VATSDEGSSLVMVVGYEGSDPARRALAAAGRILRDQEGWIEVVYVGPTEGSDHDSPEPAADVKDSLGPSQADLHYQVRSVLEGKQSWRLRSTSGAVAEELIEAAREIAREGGPSRTVVIVVGSDHRLAFSVPITLARQSSFPVVIVP
jgi:nucleotide-binding universal stress UspA family protein